MPLVLIDTGSMEDAEQLVRDVMRLDAAWGRLVLISILIDTGSMEDAEQLVRDVMRLEHNFSVTRWSGIRFKDEQFRKKMIDNLIKAGLPE